MLRGLIDNFPAPFVDFLTFDALASECPQPQLFQTTGQRRRVGTVFVSIAQEYGVTSLVVLFLGDPSSRGYELVATVEQQASLTEAMRKQSGYCLKAIIYTEGIG